MLRRYMICTPISIAPLEENVGQYNIAPLTPCTHRCGRCAVEDDGVGEAHARRVALEARFLGRRQQRRLPPALQQQTQLLFSYDVEYLTQQVYRQTGGALMMENLAVATIFAGWLYAKVGSERQN